MEEKLRIVGRLSLNTPQNKIRLVDYTRLFVLALREQLIEDEKRWGDTWRRRPVEGQEQRAFNRFLDYYDQWRYAGTPIPWLKIVGECLIAWIRENYPEVVIEE